MIFQNRHHAGQILAEKLKAYYDLNPLILALPRGGVPVAAEIARKLNAPLDVLVVRKIGAPFNAELAVGALCENSAPNFNQHILAQIGLQPSDLDQIVEIEKKEIHRQIEKFRSGHSLPSLANRVVILVDDGLATGATMAAAAKFLRAFRPAKIIGAVPVSSVRTSRALRHKLDELVVVEDRDDLMSVGEWYEDFSQVSDQQVMSLLGLRLRLVEVDVSDAFLKGELAIVPDMQALVVFAHGSGSGRNSPRNQAVAKNLNTSGFGTLLIDLLTENEEQDPIYVFDIKTLSHRLTEVVHWLKTKGEFKSVPLAFFGASTGAAAALQASTELPSAESVFAIVSRGGRPDLAWDYLHLVKAPTLLIVGGNDQEVLALNRSAEPLLEKAKVSVIPGASHLFEEPQALEEVARLAVEWFEQNLGELKLHSHRRVVDKAEEHRYGK